MGFKRQIFQTGPVFVAVVVVSPQALGASCEWKAPIDNSWTAAGSWTCIPPDSAPTNSSDTASIKNSGAFAVTLASATTINSLEFDSPNATLTGSGSLSANAFNVSSGRIEIDLIGTGSFSQAGTGTTVLTGTNDYSGGTTIEAGTLQLGSGGATGSIQGNVTDKDTLVFNRGNNYQFDGVITGGGKLVQAGTGTTVLTATNDYLGGTTIEAGVLQVNRPSALGSGEVTLAGGTLLSNFASPLDSTLNRAFTIASAQPTSTIAAKAGTELTLSGNLTLNSGSELTFGSADSSIGGTGNVKVGFNPVAISAPFNALTVAAGTLTALNGSLGQLTQGAETTTVIGNLDFNDQSSEIKNLQGSSVDGRVIMGQFSDTTLTLLKGDFAGEIQGAGQLSIKGGTTVLTGNNPYTGDTTIDTGATLQLGNGGMTGGIVSAVIQNDGALKIDRASDSAALTLGGTISGNGSLTQSGGGTTILTGTNTYAGPTTIDANSALQLGDGSTTGSIQGNVTDNGTLTFNRGNNYQFDGVITGGGNLVQAGTGTTVLTAANDYSGGTTISAGTLQISQPDALGSGVVNLSGGMLLSDFTGQLSNDFAINNGTIAAKASTELTLSGTLTLNSGSELTFGAADSNIGGTGNVKVGFNPVAISAPFSALTAAAGTLTALNGSLGQLTQGAETTTVNGILNFNDQSSEIKNLQGSSGNSRVITGRLAGTTLTLLKGNFAGEIQGAGQLSIKGGTTVLTGNNAYTGDTTIDTEATLQLGNGGATGGIVSAVIRDDGTLTFNRGDSYQFDGVISGNGKLIQAGSGSVVLTANNTYAGDTEINSGTLQLGNGGTTGGIVSAVIKNDGALRIDRSSDSDALTLGGDISGKGSLTQSGGGTTILTGTNAYSGGTMIDINSTLQLGNGGTTGSIQGNVTDNGTLTFNCGNNYQFNGVINGAGKLVQAGGGTTVLTAANDYSGGTTISAGTLQISQPDALGSGVVNLSGGMLLSDFTGQLSNDFAINNGTIAAKASTELTLSGKLTLNSGSELTFGAADSSIGGTGNVKVGFNPVAISGPFNALTVAAGTLTALNGSLGQLTQGAETTTVDGNLDFNDQSSEIKNLQGSSGNSRVITGRLAGTTLTLLKGNFAGEIQGEGQLAIKGGTTVLTGNNPYAGDTTIHTGATLQLGNGGATGGIISSVIRDDGTLTFNRGDSYQFDGVISGNGKLIQAGSGTVVLTANNTYAGDTAINSGTLQLGNGGMTGGIVSAVIRNDGGLRIDRSTDSDALTLGGDISGSGSLTQSGSGTTILTGTNTYAGGTTIGINSTLQLGDGGTTGSIVGNVTDSGTLTFNRTDEYQFNGVITGGGKLVQAGSGTTVLTAVNDYSGGTTISAGTLQISQPDALGSGVVNLNGGTLLSNFTGQLANSFDITGGTIAAATDRGLTLTGHLALGNAATVTFGATAPDGRAGTVNLATALTSPTAGPSSGSVAVAAGTLVLEDDNTYTGSTAINTNSTLQLGNGGITGGIVSAVIQNDGALKIDRASDSAALTLGGTISGSGRLTQSGGGTTILTGTNTYAGPTTIDANNTLQLGSGGTTGSIQGNVTDNGTLTFNRNDRYQFDGVISGNGNLIQAGTGTTVLTGTNTYKAGTTINAGTLQISRPDALGSGVVNLSGGMLLSDFTGQLSNDFAINNGTIAAKASTELTLSGNLTLNPGSELTYGSADSSIGGTGTVKVGFDPVTISGPFNALTVAAGTLTALNGSLGQLTQVAETTTVNSILDLNDHSSEIKNLQGSSSNSRVITGRLAGTTLTLLKGNFAGEIQGEGQLAIKGGTTVLTGNNPYAGGTMIDSGATLQLGNGATTGSIQGNVTDNGTLTFNRGDNYEFNGVINGNGKLIQAGSATVVLTANNTYAGDTAINSGTLQLGNGGTTGGIVSAVIRNDGALRIDRSSDSDTLTLGGNISGNGNLTQSGGGTTILTGTNTYAGPTTIDTNSALQLGNGGTIGSIRGDVTDNGTLTFNRTDEYQFNGVITGGGKLVQAGTGTTVLTAANAYLGGTTISAGALQLGNGGASGLIKGDVIDDGALIFNRSNQLTLSGHISGRGTVTQAGNGASVLTGPTTYTGTTDVQQGTLQFEGNGTHVSAFTGNGALVFADGTHEFNTGAAISTASLRISGGTNNLNPGSAITSAHVAISGGTNTLSQGVSLTSKRLEISGGTNNLNPGSTITTADVVIGGGTNMLSQGASLSANRVVVSGGDSDFHGTFTVSESTTVNDGFIHVDESASIKLGSTLTINGGRLDLHPDADVHQFIQTGGILSGPGDLTVSSAILSGGEMLGPGKLIIRDDGGQSTGLLLTNGFRLKNFSTLVNAGNAIISEGAYLENNSVITNSGHLTVAGHLTRAGHDGTYIQTAGTTQVDGEWNQLLTDIQAGIFRGTRSIFGELINNGTVIGDPTTGITLRGNVSGSGGYQGRVTFMDRFAPGYEYPNAAIPAGAAAQPVEGASPAGPDVAAIDASGADLVFAKSSTLVIDFGGGSKGELVTDSIRANTIALQNGNLILRRARGQEDYSPSQVVAESNILTANQITGNFSDNITCPEDSTDLYVFSKQNTRFLLTVVPRLPNQVPEDIRSLADALRRIDCSPNTPPNLQRLLNGIKPFLKNGIATGTKVEEFIQALRAISPKQMAAENVVANRIARLQVGNINQRLLDVRGVSSGFGMRGLSLNINGQNLPATLLASRAVGGAAGDEIDDDPMSRLGVFLNGQFEFGERDATITQRGYHSRLYGFTAGMDYWLTKRILAGLSLGYANNDSTLSAQTGNQTLDGYTLTAFGSVHLTDNWYVDLVASGTLNQFTNSRVTSYFDAKSNRVNETARTNFNGTQQLYSLNTGYDIPMGSWLFGLRQRTEYGYTTVDAHREKGAGLGLNLIIQDQHYDSLTTALGGMVSHTSSTPVGVFVSQLNVEWEHQFLNDARLITTRFADAPNVPFTTATYSPTRDYMNIRAAVSAQFAHGMSGFLQYDTTVGMQNFARHAFNAGIRIEF